MPVLQHQGKKIELVLRVIVNFALSLNSEMEKEDSDPNLLVYIRNNCFLQGCAVSGGQVDLLKFVIKYGPLHF